MTVRNLLPILPIYSDNSGYDVKINVLTRKTKSGWMNYDNVILGDINRSKDDNCSLYPFKSIKEILDCEVKKIQSGKSLVNGGFDETLQLYLTTEKYIKS